LSSCKLLFDQEIGKCPNSLKRFWNFATHWTFSFCLIEEDEEDEEETAAAAAARGNDLVIDVCCVTSLF